MANQKPEFKTAIFEDGTCVVLRTDPDRPRFMEVIATFHDAERARDYAQFENGQTYEEKAVAAPSKAIPEGERSEVMGELTERQKAVLNALQDRMDRDNLVEARTADLAQHANIPLGSLHSILASLQKKNLIMATRSASAKAPGVYQVLSKLGQSARHVNGAVRDGDAHEAETIAN